MKNRGRKSKIVWWVALICNLMWCVVTIVSAYGGYVNPQRSVIPAILLMGFPIMAAGNLLIAIVMLLFRSRLLLLNIATFIATIVPTWCYCPINFCTVTDADRDSTNTFTLLSFNVFGFNDYSDTTFRYGWYNPTVRYLTYSGADVVAYQEGYQCEVYSIMYDRPQFDTLMQVYPYRGKSIMSKYPFREVDFGHDQFKAGGRLEMIWYDVDINGHHVNLFSIHMQSLNLTSAERDLYAKISDGEIDRGDLGEARSGILAKFSDALKIRAKQAEYIRSVIDTVKGNIIICGDFNDVPLSYATRTLMGSNLRDAYVDAATGYVVTYHSDRFYFRIDHVLYGGDLEPLEMHRETPKCSDHYPFVTTFKFTDE